MGMHWWEWGPPALLAIGGVVELIGAALLAYEWWRGTAQAREAADLKREKVLRSGFENLPNNINNIKNIKQIKVAMSQMTLWQMRHSVSEIDDQPKTSHRSAKVGFGLFVLGIISQVAANAMAWAAAYGLLK